MYSIQPILSSILRIPNAPSQHGKISIIFLLIVLSDIMVQSSPSDSNNSKDIKASKNGEPFRIELHQKFGSQSEFTPRGVITVNPPTEYRAGGAKISQNQLTQEDLKLLKQSHEINDLYYLKAIYTGKDISQNRSTQTLIRACSIYMSNLVDFIDINLSQLNEFISVNIYSTNPECLASGGVTDDVTTNTFNTTLKIVHSTAGPYPDTATYIKRMEEERNNKLRDDKRDNRSFFGKYWIYIVAAVLILLTFGGPGQEQAAR